MKNLYFLLIVMIIFTLSYRLAEAKNERILKKTTDARNTIHKVVREDVAWAVA